MVFSSVDELVKLPDVVIHCPISYTVLFRNGIHATVTTNKTIIDAMFIASMQNNMDVSDILGICTGGNN